MPAVLIQHEDVHAGLSLLVDAGAGEIGSAEQGEVGAGGLPGDGTGCHPGLFHGIKGCRHPLPPT